MCSDGSCLDNLPERLADGLQSEQHELLQGIVVLCSGTHAISPILRDEAEDSIKFYE